MLIAMLFLPGLKIWLHIVEVFIYIYHFSCRSPDSRRKDFSSEEQHSECTETEWHNKCLDSFSALLTSLELILLRTKMQNCHANSSMYFPCLKLNCNSLSKAEGKQLPNSIYFVITLSIFKQYFHKNIIFLFLTGL